VTRLSTYKKKRSPHGPEPRGRIKRGKGELIFVVQKHQASHLHFDLRLELEGVLKSWAVPKGPSTRPEEKRLAVMVEDHPYDYKDFAGVIPTGNYGAGVVTIWDKGTYEVPGATSTVDAEKKLKAGLKKGHVVFELKGKKLKGEYALVRLSQPGQEKNWLLFAKSKTKIEKPKKDKRPQSVSPMLATLGDKPFNKKGWLFELKLDGYRAIADIDAKHVRLTSRNDNSFNRTFPQIAQELAVLAKHAPILDGEVVALDEHGRSRFQLLQNYIRTSKGSVYYYVFDVLYCDGIDYRDQPLADRKVRLESLLADLHDSHVRYCDHVEDKGVALFTEAKKRGLEGVIAKDAQSVYQMKRSSDWIKIKSRQYQEVFIGGYTEARSGPSSLGSLMVGVKKGKQLVYLGQVGTGFSQAVAKALKAKLKALGQSKSPFKTHAKLDMTAHYVEPVLKCQVSFTEKTDEGYLRHPVFEGLQPPKGFADPEGAC